LRTRFIFDDGSSACHARCKRGEINLPKAASFRRFIARTPSS
jgi:hypothetical protein